MKIQEERSADTASHWAKDYIAAAVAGGIAGGYDNNTFGPDDAITREQIAVMVVKAAQLGTPADGKILLPTATVSPAGRGCGSGSSEQWNHQRLPR